MIRYALRPVRPDDAESIADLFRQAYVLDGGSGIAYPYPQLLTATGARSLMQRKDIVWHVAEGPQALAGSLCSVLYGQPPIVNVAELFGLVVDAEARRQGVGSRLFGQVVAALKQLGATLILSETRTREAGGTSIVRTGGFEPVGYVPLGHRTPGGMEAMLPCAWILPASDTPPSRSVALPPRALNLRRRFQANRAITPGFGLATVAHSAPDRRDPRDIVRPLDILICGAGSADATRSLIHEIQVRCRVSQPFVHLMGLGGQTEASDRFIEVAIVATAEGSAMGALIASFDCFDERIRVLEAASVGPSITLALLDRLEDWRNDCGSRSSSSPPTLVLDIRADQEGMLTALESRGYVPTTLHPHLVAEVQSDGMEQRVDAFRYELLPPISSAIADSVRCWPEAFAIATCVLESCRTRVPGQTRA